MRALAALPFTALLGRSAMAARQTPTSTEGPFYPTPRMRFADIDNNLVKISGVVEEAGGEIVILKGTVRNQQGAPVAGARVEIWQCDVNGRYLHAGDRNASVPRDPAFQGFGHTITDAGGAYAFRTIKPVPYPGRTPHIHVKVLHAGGELTSQLYLKGHPLNARDFIFQRLSPADRRAVSMAFAPSPDGPLAEVDIVV